MAQQFDPYHTDGIRPIVPGKSPGQQPAGFCENCGAPLKAGQPFCSSCGHKNEFMEEPETTSGKQKEKEPDEGKFWDEDQTNEEGEPYLDEEGNKEADPEETPYARNLRKRQEAERAGQSRGGSRAGGTDTGAECREAAGPQSREAGGAARPQSREAGGAGRPQGREAGGTVRPQGRGAGEAVRPQERRIEHQPRPQREIYRDYYAEYEERQRREKKTTPTQIVLIVVLVVLLILFAGVTAFWFIHQAGSQNRIRVQSTIVTDNVKEQTVTEKPAATEKPETKITETSAAGQEASAKPDIVMEYEEYEVTIPGRWTGKYGTARDENSVSFYQNASRIQGQGGQLFSIVRYTDNSYEDLPNYTVLGTGNNAAFIFTEPTDVQFAQDSEAARQEYTEMAKDLNWIKTHITVTAQGEGPSETEAPETQALVQAEEPVQEETEAPAEPEADQASDDEYILAGSSDHELTDEELSGLSADEAQMAINEIYARHGNVFQSSEIQSYFESKSWYQAADSMSGMSDLEWANITKLQEVVAARRSAG